MHTNTLAAEFGRHVADGTLEGGFYRAHHVVVLDHLFRSEERDRHQEPPFGQSSGSASFVMRNERVAGRRPWQEQILRAEQSTTRA